MTQWHLDEGSAAELAGRWFPDFQSLSPLNGDHDQNILVTAGGQPRAVLKITADSPERSAPVLDLQIKLMEHLAGGAQGVSCPLPVANKQGRYIEQVDGRGGCRHAAWMVSYIDGCVLDEVDAYDAELLEDIGRSVAVVDDALATFAHTGARRKTRWDLARVMALAGLAEAVTDDDKRILLNRQFERLEQHLLPRLASRPRGIIHNDGGNQHNMIVAPDGPDHWRVRGLIDFGDAVLTQRICGLGIAATYALFGVRDPGAAIGVVCRGYHRVIPLTGDDIALVPDLIRARLAMSLAISSQRAVSEPDNDYLQVSAKPAWRLLAWLDKQDVEGLGRRIEETIHDSN